MTAITAAEVAISEARTRAVRDEALNLLLDRLPYNNLTITPSHGASITVTVTVLRPIKLTTHTYYVCASPWSRGWSVFTTDDPRAGAYSWRDVPSHLAGLQRPLYCPRGLSGAWRIAPADLASAIEYCVTRLERLDQAARKRVTRKHWYWPTTTLSRAYSDQNQPSNADDPPHPTRPNAALPAQTDNDTILAPHAPHAPHDPISPHPRRSDAPPAAPRGPSRRPRDKHEQVR